MKSRWHAVKPKIDKQVVPQAAPVPAAQTPDPEPRPEPVLYTTPIGDYTKKVGRFGRPKRYHTENPVMRNTRLPAQVDAALMLFARQQRANVSAYVRQLIIDDLVRRGYLKV